ncbi:MAG: hypothetical protein H7A37_02320 [Chlamydiales bacterium]|nr:hypothetical protein [Chlamydiales bacterium]
MSMVTVQNTSYPEHNNHQLQPILTAQCGFKGKVVHWNIVEKTGLAWPEFRDVTFSESLYDRLSEKGCTELQIACFIRQYATYYILTQDPKAKFCDTRVDFDFISVKNIYTISDAGNLDTITERLSDKINQLLPWICPQLCSSPSHNDIPSVIRSKAYRQVMSDAEKAFIKDGNIEPMRDGISHLEKIMSIITTNNPLFEHFDQLEKQKSSSLQRITMAAVQKIKEGDTLSNVAKLIAKLFKGLCVDLFRGKSALVGISRRSCIETTLSWPEQFRKKLIENVENLDLEMKSGVIHHSDNVYLSKPIQVSFKDKTVSLTLFLLSKEWHDRCESNAVFGCVSEDNPSVAIGRNTEIANLMPYLEYLYQEYIVHNPSDKEGLIRKLGALHWGLFHAKLFEEANNEIAERIIIALAKSKELDISGCKSDIYLQALITREIETFAKGYKDLLNFTYEGEENHHES